MFRRHPARLYDIRHLHECPETREVGKLLLERRLTHRAGDIRLSQLDELLQLLRISLAHRLTAAIYKILQQKCLALANVLVLQESLCEIAQDIHRLRRVLHRLCEEARNRSLHLGGLHLCSGL